MDELILVITQLPDRAVATTLAQALVERRLAACVNVLGPCESVYRWKGAVETATEVPVFIKTRAGRYDEVEAAIREFHPYELPEIVTVPMRSGLDDYLKWVADQTSIAIG
jgi:periplasmic divalent cation tolerance protein